MTPLLTPLMHSVLKNAQLDISKLSSCLLKRYDQGYVGDHVWQPDVTGARDLRG